MWAAGATGAMEKMKMIGKTRSAATTITVLLLATVARTGIAEEIPGLLGSWRATEFTISHPELPPVEMIALGGALWLTIDPGDRYVLTSQSPDQRVPEADAGSWRVISDAQIEIQPDGFSEARPLTVGTSAPRSARARPQNSPFSSARSMTRSPARGCMKRSPSASLGRLARLGLYKPIQAASSGRKPSRSKVARAPF